MAQKAFIHRLPVGTAGKIKILRLGEADGGVAYAHLPGHFPLDIRRG